MVDDNPDELPIFEELQRFSKELGTSENYTTEQKLLDCYRQFRHLMQREQKVRSEAADWKQMAIQQGDRCLLLEGRLAELETQCLAMERALGHLLQGRCGDCPHDDFCQANPGLRGQCVLYVGRVNQHVSRFRALVESQEGSFIHCDENKDGLRSLAGLISQADLVMCSLDRVSQVMASKARRYCDYHVKRLVELPKTSLPIFADALVRAES